MNLSDKYRGYGRGLLLLAITAGPLWAGAGESDAATDLTPDLATFAAIDRALEGTWVLPPGAIWRYFPGTAEPSPDLEWTEDDFDDSTWLAGPSPFVNGVPGEGTRVPEMGASVTTLYLRCVLDVPGLRRFERIVMELPVDDGFILYFNGDPTQRRNAGERADTPTFESTASAERSVQARPVTTSDLTRTIEGGANQLAIQALVHADDRETFAIEPAVWAEYRRSPELDRERFDALRALLATDSDPDARTTYLEARHAQRSGDLAAAAAGFRRLCELDPSSALAWQRRIECHRELGTLSALEAECRAALSAESPPTMVESWARMCLEDMDLPPGHVASSLPPDWAVRRGSLLDDVLWVARELEAGNTLRIDCGEERDREIDGVTWSRDRFFAPASIARTTASSGAPTPGFEVGRTVRIAARSLDELTPTYRIPLPPGAYELRVGFVGNDGEECEPGEAPFDLLVEGARVARAYDPVVEAGRRGIDVHSFPMWIDDGFLELDFTRRGKLDPWIAGIELRALDGRAFHEHAAAWVAASEDPPTFALVQLAASLIAADEPVQALALLERAEARPDFLPAHAELLGTLRLALVPELHSLASADGLVQRYPARSEASLPAIRAAAGEDVTWVTYMAGRLHQEAGRVDDALAAFEELVASRIQDPRPYLRMAQCLIAADLPEHAIDILDDARSGGIAPTPEWIQLWISLNLDTLGRAPWEVIADLRSLGAPETLVVVPTSELTPQTWHTSVPEPPSTAWSRTTFDASAWPSAPGALGSGRSIGASTRGLWNTDSLYAQRRFTLGGHALLYPHLSVFADGAVNVYVNGQALGFVGVETRGYIPMPARDGTWLPGENVLGMHAFNQTGDSSVDVGVILPLGDLMWVARELEEQGAVRLNCGGAELTMADGKRWGADRFFGWGQRVGLTEDEPWIEIAGTEDDALYQSLRVFYSDVISTWYQIPVPDGAYRVTLHFAEIEGDKAVGERTFLVSLEKKIVLREHDIVACAGLAAADVHTFDVVVQDGWLDLRLFDLDHFAVICALEIEPTPE